MADGTLGIDEPTTIDKNIDAEKLTVGGQTVYRERTVVPAPISFNGGPVTVGITAVELTFTGITKVISIKAASTNTGLIWFGGSNIDNTGANALGELTADAAVEIELNDADAAVYVVSDTASQKVYKAALIPDA